VLGSREALFAFAQTVVDGSRAGATVVMPNPFYQILRGRGAARGAEPYCVNADAARAFAPAWDDVPDEVWARTQLLYVCSPDNPTGRVTTQAEWARLFALSDRHGFVIAPTSAYSEVYFDEARPPLGALGAARALGRDGFPRLVTFGSLSKRSNAPGMRSGYIAGDAALVKAFLLYRTYHGSGHVAGGRQPPASRHGATSARAAPNRAQYAAKFTALQPRLAAVLPWRLPDAAFYLWAPTPIDDAVFAKRLLAEAGGDRAARQLPRPRRPRREPGRGYVRIALVASLDECTQAIDRMVALARSL